METRFVSLEVTLRPSPGNLRETIETALSAQGTPLRWAITQLDQTQQIAIVEAIVTAPPLTP